MKCLPATDFSDTDLKYQFCLRNGCSYFKFFNNYSIIFRLPGVDIEFRVSPTLDGLDKPESLCFNRPGKSTGRPETFVCTTPITGRYVKTLRKAYSNFLCFDELEVFT